MFVRATLILVVFNLAIWYSITKLPNLMCRQYFCVYGSLIFVVWEGITSENINRTKYFTLLIFDGKGHR